MYLGGEAWNIVPGLDTVDCGFGYRCCDATVAVLCRLFISGLVGQMYGNINLRFLKDTR